MGLYLLTLIAARDFGWIGAQEAVERLEATLHTFSQFELYRGHFFNWYDTLSFKPLDPKYISSVDSGNLAGNLLVLSSACRGLIQEPFVESRMFAGVATPSICFAKCSAKLPTPAVLRRSRESSSATQSNRWPLG